MLALSAGPAVSSAGGTRVAEAAEGSAGSTGAGRIGGDADLDGAVIGFAVDTAAASPSVPQTS